MKSNATYEEMSISDLSLELESLNSRLIEISDYGSSFFNTPRGLEAEGVYGNIRKLTRLISKRERREDK